MSSVSDISTMTTPVDEDEFRVRVRSFLDEHASPRAQAQPQSEDRMDVSQAKGYQAALFAAGLAGLTWPKQYGGQGLPGRYQTLFNDIATQYDLPDRAVRDRVRYVHADPARARDRRPEGAIHPAGVEGGGDLVPAVLRALVRIGPRQPSLVGGEGRRRMGAQRPEGVDIRCALLTVGDPAGPQRP